jgi:hypothetical protein
MKFILSFALICFSLISYGQVPQKMSYQAVVRNAQNQLIQNNAVGMRLSILEGSPVGTTVYVETHVPITNGNGSVTIEIGNGTVVSGVFANIDWSTGLYWLQTEVDPQGAQGYSITGVSQLLTVPYAFYCDYALSSAESIDSIGDNGNGTLTIYYTGGATYTTGVLAGLQGANGADGIDGIDGESAYELWISQGNSGTQAAFLDSLIGADGANGSNGINGVDGESTYELWISQGNSGTEIDFINSLSGTDGTNGVNGIDGVDGTLGANSLMTTTIEPVGLNCASGGVMIEIGLDTNFNNSLDPFEVDPALTTYICNGSAAALVAGPGIGITGNTISNTSYPNYISNTQIINYTGQTTSQTYINVDVSPYVSANATHVILKVHAYASEYYRLDFRKNSASTGLYEPNHAQIIPNQDIHELQLMVPLDANGSFEYVFYKFAGATNGTVTVDIIGYTE